MREKCDDRPTSEPPTARSAGAHGQRARTEPKCLTKNWAELTALLKLLISEHIAAGAALPPEAANE